MHCYCDFSSTRGVYLAKNHNETLSPQMIPMAQIWGPGSWTNMPSFSNAELEIVVAGDVKRSARGGSITTS